jgi:hypothetical protein
MGLEQKHGGGQCYPPIKEMVKYNFDGASKRKPKLMGSHGLFRDHYSLRILLLNEY